MNAKQAIKMNIEGGDMVSMMYLEDLTDEEMMKRPCSGCNHINWQVGHLILAENGMLGKIAPESIPPLPTGFAEKYSKEAASSDDPKKFLKKSELLQLYRQQRNATLAALEKIDEAKLDAPSGFDFAPTVAHVLSLQGGHWLMHAGQWAVVRRQCGRKPLF